jgi:hypothetical protein
MTAKGIVMFRILFALLIIYLLYALWKRVSQKTTRINKTNIKHDLTPGEMVPCAKCQTFILKAEAIEKGGKFYCSKHCTP